MGLVAFSEGEVGHGEDQRGDFLNRSKSFLLWLRLFLS